MSQYGIQKVESMAFIKRRLIIVHSLAVVALFVPWNWQLAVLLAVTFSTRMFGIEGGYHRYFAHRAFKTSRVFQFILAVLGASTGQRGALWWAAHHRTHHRFTDAEGDLHSPREGLWHSHMGWMLDPKNVPTNLDAVPDLAKYPELRFISKYYHLPMLALLIGMAVGGKLGWFGPSISAWHAVLVGFFLSTILVLHATFAVNSLVHLRDRFGSYRRFDTKDDATNHALLSIITMGASWHNNHHRYRSAARAGFAWYEIDLSYVVLRLLSAVGVVWDLRPVPAEVLREGRLLPAEARQEAQTSQESQGARSAG